MLSDLSLWQVVVLCVAALLAAVSVFVIVSRTGSIVAQARASLKDAVDKGDRSPSKILAQKFPGQK